MLYPEYRNHTLFEALGLECPGSQYMHPMAATYQHIIIAAGTELKVDRVYLRQGVPDYDAITFRSTINHTPVRFWAKLVDVNKLEVSVIL